MRKEEKGKTSAGRHHIVEGKTKTAVDENMDADRRSDVNAGGKFGGSDSGGRTGGAGGAGGVGGASKMADGDGEKGGNDDDNDNDNDAEEFGRRKGHVGTPDYMAPEILLGREHTEAVDWWSLGVVAYELMTGAPPFNSTSAEEVFTNILQRKLVWPDERARRRDGKGGSKTQSENNDKDDDDDDDDDADDVIVISHEGKQFIEALLVLNPEKRLGTKGGVREVKKHVFFAEVPWERLTLDHTYVPFVPNIEGDRDTSYFSPDRRQQMNTVEEPPTPVSRQVSHGHRFKNFAFNIEDSDMREGDESCSSNNSTPRK
jgi:serine/threonine-protein kinase greatwall